VTAGGKLKVGYFAQHQIEELVPDETPFQHMERLLPGAKPGEVRSQLGRFGFSGEKANLAVRQLSGGERARLSLALITRDAPHILILDEPTNHLDVDAREALVRALNDYEGAVILITHDRHLIDACADRLWIVRGGTVRTYDGDMDQYRTECLAERGGDPDAPRAKAKANGAARQTAQDARRQAAESRTALAPLRKTDSRAVQAVEPAVTFDATGGEAADGKR
jgi:ATP-binding cassette subfamily F protein 3